MEVCDGGIFKTVCEKNWDDNDAQVVCTQIGLGTAGKPVLLSDCVCVCLVYLSVFSLSVCHHSVCLRVACLSVCLTTCTTICLSVCLFELSVCQSVCLSVSPSVCLSIIHVYLSVQSICLPGCLVHDTGHYCSVLNKQNPVPRP